LCSWEKHGIETIARVREQRPHEYLKVVTSILPKDLNLNVSPFEHMTDAELEDSIKRLLAGRMTGSRHQAQHELIYNGRADSGSV
jgi:hypothetical protein